jgi:hypothetical protein
MGTANTQMQATNAVSGTGCTSGTNVGANSVHAYAYAVANPGNNASSGATFTAATLAQYGLSYGLGVNYAGEPTGAPEHTMDNKTQTELIAFRFDQAVTLDKITLGYTTNDADFSVFAWNGATPNSSASDKITDQTVGTLASSWTLVGNYANAAGASNTTDVVTTVNAGNVSSSWWIISAYNTGYGGALDGSATTNNLDYMKVMSIASKSPGNQTPEPGSIALIGISLISLVAARRRSHKAD